MTFTERVAAVAGFGFTERQARFVVHVLLFGGLCVPRQYAMFARTAYGHNVSGFLATLVNRGYATECRCIHNRARLYHVHYRPLYDAIGEPFSPYRLAVPAGRTVERLIQLDAVLHHADLQWLIGDAEKVRFIDRVVSSCPREHLPHMTVGTGARRRVRLFPDDVLMGIDAAHAPVFVCAVTTPREDDLVAAFQRYADLLAALPRWKLRLLFPAHLATGMGRYQVTFRSAVAEPLSPRTVDEMRWYFEQLRRAAQTHGDPVEERRFRRAQHAFATSRSRILYRRWLTDGEAAFRVVSSHAIIEHLANETGRLECERLPVSYRHLSPVVSPTHSTAARVEDGVERGAEERHESPHVLDPSSPVTMSRAKSRSGRRSLISVNDDKPFSLQ